MSATLAGFGPVGWFAIVAGSALGYVCLGVAVGRFCGFSDPGDDGAEPAAYPPPVPPRQVPDEDEDDADWLLAWPSVEEAEQAAYDSAFAAIVADLRSAS